MLLMSCVIERLTASEVIIEPGVDDWVERTVAKRNVVGEKSEFSVPCWQL